VPSVVNIFEDRMRLGIDFDNTIACYRTAFHRAAVARGLVPAEPVLAKNQVRDHLRRLGREDEWTALQGYIYGPGLADVEVFPGFVHCLKRLLASGATVFIISHKTRTPYRGPAFDLHAAARAWIERQGFLGPEVGLPHEHVFFELTLRDKLRRIAAQGCTHFVDDLVELLAEPEFPADTERILFDPEEAHVGGPFRRAGSWAELDSWLNHPSN
jgi:hypothetical protein